MESTANKRIYFRCVEHGGKDYAKTVELRDEVLRKPLGLIFSADDLKAENDSFHLSLWEKEQVVACLILKQIDKKTMKMRQVAVRFDRQNEGLGKKLVHYAEFFAKALGCEKIVLHARETAVKFYLKMNGYVLSEDSFEEVGIPHFKMEKTLPKRNLNSY
jgi:predicted GNAT family N-acyltransferase